MTTIDLITQTAKNQTILYYMTNLYDELVKMY